MKNRIIYSLFLLVLVGCVPPISEEDAKARINRIEFEEIELDDSEGEVDLTRNFYFIVDGSGSMDSGPGQDCTGSQSFNKKILGAKWAVKQFLQKVPDNVNIGLYVFDNSGQEERVPLGSGNRQKFLEAIEAIEPGRDTPLARAIELGTDRLVEQYKKQLGYGEYRLIVVTDGRADYIPSASEYAIRKRIAIYAIGLCIGENHPLRHYSVSYRAADSFEDLAAGLEETLAETDSFDLTDFPQFQQN